MNQETKTTPEDDFRESLADVAVIVQKLGPLCNSWEEMVAMLKLGTENPAQLKLIMKVVTGK